VLGSRFREVYFVSRFEDGDAYVPLKMVLTLMKMYTVYDCVVASKGADPFADAGAFMRWFASYLSTISVGGVRIREEAGEIEVLYGNAGIMLTEAGTTIRNHADSALPKSTIGTAAADWDDLGSLSDMPAYEEAHAWDLGIFYPAKTGNGRSDAP
jgi:hypothetical protein